MGYPWLKLTHLSRKRGVNSSHHILGSRRPSLANLALRAPIIPRDQVRATSRNVKVASVTISSIVKLRLSRRLLMSEFQVSADSGPPLPVNLGGPRRWKCFIVDKEPNWELRPLQGLHALVSSELSVPASSRARRWRIDHVIFLLLEQSHEG